MDMMVGKPAYFSIRFALLSVPTTTLVYRDICITGSSSICESF
ncbi:hypothetical protein glysoja_013300 [Glycine soja]|nr:hypothetical protein glysoja_013300 [Glycine soja]